MRIISGKHGSKRFYPPEHLPIRPTTDFAKTGIFNVLSNYYNFNRIRVLDLFAGSGAISFEFASRGCMDITAVDQDDGCVRFVTQQAEELGMDALHICHADAFQFMDQCTEQFDIVFAGPPYALQNIRDIPDLVFKHNLLTDKGWHILEHSKKLDIGPHPKLAAQRKYGTTIFSIFTRE